MRARRSGESALLLLDAVAVLTTHGIDYAVIGAMAASVHGVVRASVDADAVLSLTIRELGELEETFRAAGFQTELRRGDPDDPIPAMLVLSDSLGNRVDLLAGLRGLEAAAFSRAIEVPFQDAALKIVGREDFIAMKLFAGGPQDMADARHAFAIGRESLDTDLLRRLAARYGREAARALDGLLAS